MEYSPTKIGSSAGTGVLPSINKDIGGVSIMAKNFAESSNPLRPSS